MENFTIDCFVAVADTLSFTKAAERLGRTQSAITQQIANLERKLNVILFKRGKKIVLTKEGELFLPYALRIHALYQEVVDRFKNPELDGEVRIGVPEDFAALFLSDVLVDFSRIHPQIFMNVECDLTVNLLKSFREGSLDLAIVKMSSLEEFPNGVEIWQEPLVWVGRTSQASWIEERGFLPLVVSPAPCIYRTRALLALEKEGIRSRIVYTSPSYSGTIAAVKASMGVTVLPMTMIPEPLEVIKEPILPHLPEIHVSLLRQTVKSGQGDVSGQKVLSPAIETLYRFLLKKLMPMIRNNLQFDHLESC